LELGRAYRGTYWCGTNAEEWIGLGLSALLYGAAIALIGGALRKLTGSGASWTALIHTAVAASSLLIGMRFGGTVEQPSAYSLSETGLFGVVALGFTLFGTIAVRRGAGVWVVCLPMLLGLLLATLALARASETHFVELQERVYLCKLASATGLVGFPLFLAGVWVVTARARWRVGSVLAGVAVVYLTISVPPSKDNPIEGPNLLLITADALRADYCGAYGGHVPTPTLTQLGERGVLFEQSYALAPWTRPAMHSMFASAYPLRMPDTGTQDEWETLQSNEVFQTDDPTLAEALRDKGYATAAFVANPLLGDLNGVTRGFENAQVWHHGTPVPSGYFSHVPHLRAFIDGFGRVMAYRPPDTSRLITAYATRYLRHAGDRPFFLWLHYMDPHTPHDPPAAYREQDGPWPIFSPLGDYWDTPQIDDFAQVDISVDEQAYVKHLYEAEMRYLDDCMGEVMEVFEETGRKADTHLCFTSDHGEELWDHGKYFHGHTVYDELMRVPLLFAGPGVEASRIAVPVSAIDIMPTLADLLGVGPGATWKGTSFAASLRGEVPYTAKTIYGQGANKFAWPRAPRMIRVDGDKLIHDAPSGDAELYDLATDPAEQHDNAETRVNEVGDLLNQLNAWSESFIDTLDEVELDPDQVEAVRESMESVGYL
jgi:arylsulfatase A-like enzyme